MNEFDKECDATLDAARKNLAESRRLAGECAAAFQARRDWETANGLDAAKRQRFFTSLSPEDRKRVEEENEQFQREVAHDLERATPGTGSSKPGKNRRRYI